MMVLAPMLVTIFPAVRLHYNDKLVINSWQFWGAPLV
jgi:hypothetical protein